MKKILVKSYEADIIVVWYLMISVILLSPFISYKNIINIGTFGLISLAGLGIIVVAAGITLFTSGLRDVKAHHAGIISYIEPLGAILWGALIIKEIPSMLTIGGGSLILLSTYVLIKNRDK